MTTPSELIARRTALALQSEIPDMSDYALQWFALAREFDALGMEHNARLCRRNGDHYSELADGNYSRVIEGSFSEIRKTDEEPPLYDVSAPAARGE